MVRRGAVPETKTIVAGPIHVQFETMNAGVRIDPLPHTLRFKTFWDLTPKSLGTQIVPYLQALADMQQVFNAAKRLPQTPSVIKSITQRSPLSVNIQGVNDALNSLKEEVVPWRKAHAKKIADLREKEAEVEIKKRHAEAAELRAQSANSKAESKKTEAEAAKLWQEVETQKLLNDRAKLELGSLRLTLALDIASKLRPDFTDQEKLSYAFQLMGSLETLTNTAIDVTVVGPQQLGSASIALDP